MEVSTCASVGPHGGHCEDVPGGHLAAGQHYGHGLSGGIIRWSDAYPRDPEIQGLIDQVADQYPDAERRSKARTVRSVRSQLDHCLMLQSLGHWVEPGLADRLADQLSELSSTAPYLTLAEVS